MHSNTVQALAGNTISALRTPKTFTDYSHSPILRVLRDKVFSVCQTTGTVTGDGTGYGTQNGNGNGKVPPVPRDDRLILAPGGHHPKG